MNRLPHKGRELSMAINGQVHWDKVNQVAGCLVIHKKHPMDLFCKISILQTLGLYVGPRKIGHVSSNVPVDNEYSGYNPEGERCVWVGF